MAENEEVQPRDTQDPEPRGVTRETHEWVSGEHAGAVITNSGAFPGGPEMENWKRTPKEDNTPEGSIEEQAANLRDRVENS
jgi:hypothetical protein